MSKFTNELQEALIHNSHEFFGKGNVYISYMPADNGRGGRSAYWYVARPGYETNPDSHWRDYGNKVFLVWGGGKQTHKEAKASTLEEAQKWVEEKYGIKEWARDPFGAYGEATFVKARTKALKAKIKNLPFRTGDSVLVNGEGDVRVIARINRADSIKLEGDPAGYNGITYNPSELTKVEI